MTSQKYRRLKPQLSRAPVIVLKSTRDRQGNDLTLLRCGLIEYLDFAIGDPIEARCGLRSQVKTVANSRLE
ncbi:MAG: hypothetical protein ACC700_15170, partial [Anaerolineales bacterium]